MSLNHKACTADLENKLKEFRSNTKTRKTLFLTMITTYGVRMKSIIHACLKRRKYGCPVYITQRAKKVSGYFGVPAKKKPRGALLRRPLVRYTNGDL